MYKLTQARGDDSILIIFKVYFLEEGVAADYIEMLFFLI